MIYLPWISNFVRNATVTANASAAGFPVSNLKTRFACEPWRTTGSYGVVSIDSGSAVDFNLIAVVNYNMTESGTVQIVAGPSAAPNGTFYTTYLPHREHDRFTTHATQTCRYF